ncbi:LytR/AlgR family response regulator transcription factor [Chitinophaga nivalis]|uniref:LytTR family DNA-binding domain-containing protein n=1 Tax=Chitinophaga nivalis TaxID=2991709 RepID=A0ABT3IP78_9BACT|nr:LytTR family DNA-binding domain-containing protein [Chitinophaga nivalis]MCW3464550.1 LytTR family DNA-binding domain-containing protein [Chitinophaga nivalis]MCW3485759.1 LytTR family DNA-binding domain-containing protein [Chitinophaga nivalis]
MIRCIATDDEQLVRELLEDYIREVPFLQLIKTCRNAMETCEALQAGSIDLLFLDIQMPRLSGLQLVQSLSQPPLVIFVTAYEQYALEGFNLQAVDYLLKPFTFERFLKACNRANDLLRLQRGVTTTTPEIPDFFVYVEYTQVKIVVADVEYVEGLKDYIKIYLSGQPHPVLTRMSLKAIEEKLPPPAFIRTHKSFLVAARKVTRIKRDFVSIGTLDIPVSEFYKENVTRLLQ